MSAIRSTTIIDEMFPEASGNNMMELDEVIVKMKIVKKLISYYKIQPITSTNYNIEAGNVEKIIHTEYFNS